MCTPGRCLGLINSGKLKLDKVKHFVVDECDKCLQEMDMRKDVQSIFTSTPHHKQVMMFSATLDKAVCSYRVVIIYRVVLVLYCTIILYYYHTYSISID